MPIPAIVGAGLSAAARVIAKNKKAREALVDFTKQLRKGITRPRVNTAVEASALSAGSFGLGMAAAFSEKKKKPKAKTKTKKSMTWNK